MCVCVWVTLVRVCLNYHSLSQPQHLKTDPVSDLCSEQVPSKQSGESGDVFCMFTLLACVGLFKTRMWEGQINGCT